MGEIKTKHNWYPNTSIEFKADCVRLRVSLNIEPGLAKYLSPNNVAKGKKYHVYGLVFDIPNELICRNAIEQAQVLIINRVQNSISIAKQKRDESKKIN